MAKTTKDPETVNRKAVALLRAKYKTEKSWSAVGKILKLNKGLVNAVARGVKKAPPKVLRALGLPVTTNVLAQVCPECGEAHIRTARCPKKKKLPRHLIDWPVEVLAHAIRNRQ